MAASRVLILEDLPAVCTGVHQIFTQRRARGALERSEVVRRLVDSFISRGRREVTAKRVDTLLSTLARIAGGWLVSLTDSTGTTLMRCKTRNCNNFSQILRKVKMLVEDARLEANKAAVTIEGSRT
jgi:hypothetical protein